MNKFAQPLLGHVQSTAPAGTIPVADISIAFRTRLTLALTRWGPWTLLLDVPAIFIATAVCLLIGTVFGIFPAVKASRLDPMESLTVE